MKTYYIRYPRDFENEYDLCYCETAVEQGEAEAAGFERITRKEAEGKCKAERDRRKYNQAFSGFGDAEIVPWSFLADPRNQPDHPAYPIYPEEAGLTRNGYIWE